MLSGGVVTISQYEIDWDAIGRGLSLAGEIAVGILSGPAGCSSGDDDDGGNGHVDGDADGGDVPTEDGIDAEFGDIPDGGDADSDSGDGVDCSAPRTGINDDYARTVFATVNCNVLDLDVVGNYIYGVCDYPSNRVFSCQIQSDPMASTTCSGVFTIEPRSTLPDDTMVDNIPRQITSLGDRMAILYNTPLFDAYPNNVILLNSGTHTRAQEDIALGAIIFGSGSDPITVYPRNASAVVLSGSTLYVATDNYDSSRGQYERGTVYVLESKSSTDRDFDPADVSLFFTNGRNPTAMAALDNYTIAVLNAHGTASEIPATIAPDEVAGASIDIIDVTEPSMPAILQTVPIADVKFAALPELNITSDGALAVVGTVDAPPAIYSVSLTDTPSVRSLDMPAGATGSISSIEIAETSPRLILVSMSGGNLYTINLDTMMLSGSAVYLGEAAQASAHNVAEAVLYQAVTGPWCGASGESRIIAVDPY